MSGKEKVYAMNVTTVAFLSLHKQLSTEIGVCIVNCTGGHG